MNNDNSHIYIYICNTLIYNIYIYYTANYNYIYIIHIIMYGISAVMITCGGYHLIQVVLPNPNGPQPSFPKVSKMLGKALFEPLLEDALVSFNKG